MNEKEAFAVWIATTILNASGDPFGAAALTDIAEKSKERGDLDVGLKEAAKNIHRPGDFGVEFIAPLLPVLFVEFGRALWDAYVKSVADKGGKALATATVNSVKALVHQTFSERSSTLTLEQAKAKLSEAGKKCGLSNAQIHKLLDTLRKPEVMRALGNE